jgi:hypothetical protein
MQFAPFVAITSVLALTLLPVSAFAQDWSQPWADSEDRPPRIDFSASSGFLMPTRWSDVVLFGSLSPALGALEQVLSRDVHVEPDTQFTATTMYWRGRYGFRVRGGFSRSSLTISGVPVTGLLSSTPGDFTGDITSVGVNTWLYDVGGAIGFVEYAPSRRVWPYGFVGLGGITYDLKTTIAPPLTFVQHDASVAATNHRIIVVNGGRQFLLTTNALSTETVFAANIGLGVDFSIPHKAGGLAVRVEVADHLAGSPLALRVEELSPFGVAPSDTGVRYRLVHHLSVTVGLVVQIGR